MIILYLGYPLTEDGAPHQAMAAFYFARQNIQIKFLAWGNNPLPTWLKEYPTLTYEQVPKKRTLWSAINFYAQFIAQFIKVKPDVLYIQGAQQTPYCLILLLFKRKKTKYIYHTQDYVGPGQQFFYEWCEKFTARRVDHVISNEPNRARFMASNYRLNQVPSVIRTALPSWWDVPGRDDQYRNALLVQLGLEQVKNPRLIIAGGAYRLDRMSDQYLEAFAKLPNNYGIIFNAMPDNCESRQKCNVQLAKLNLLQSSRILFFDALPYDQLFKLFAACDIGILLYPNSGVGHFYQAPGRLTEYLRCGLSIVCSNFPGLELLTLKYNLGAVADPYDPVSIMQAILKVGEVDDITRNEISARLIKLAKGDLLYEKQASIIFKNCLLL